MFAANGATDGEAATSGRGRAPALGVLVAEASSQAVFESLSSVFEVRMAPSIVFWLALAYHLWLTLFGTQVDLLALVIAISHRAESVEDLNEVAYNRSEIGPQYRRRWCHVLHGKIPQLDRGCSMAALRKTVRAFSTV